jgi:hypothetical protein
LGPVVALLGCGDDAPPEIPEAGLPHIIVTYVCGNDFDLQHQIPTALTVQYRVMGSSETGELVLPGSPEGGISSTRLTTFRPGALPAGPVEWDRPHDGDDPWSFFRWGRRPFAQVTGTAARGLELVA